MRAAVLLQSSGAPGAIYAPQQKKSVPSRSSSSSCVGPSLLIQSERLLGLDELRTAILAGA
jgi:hypothetical protein